MARKVGGTGRSCKNQDGNQHASWNDLIGQGHGTGDASIGRGMLCTHACINVSKLLRKHRINFHAKNKGKG